MNLLDIEPGTYFFVPSLDPQKTREEVMHAAYSERVLLSTVQPAGVFNGVYGNNWPVLAAAVLMIAAPMAIFFVFMQRYIIGGVTAGAVKG